MTVLSRLLSLGLLTLCVLSFSACAHGPREPRGYHGAYPGGYTGGYSSVYDADYRASRQQEFVQYGRVRSIEQFGGDYRARERRENGAGAVVGGLVGGVIGNQVGHGNDRAAATVLGAVAGAVIGNAIERQEVRTDDRRAGLRYRVWVQLEGAGEQAFDFERLDGLRVGERVRVVDGRLQRY